ncbi:hypothetical protein HUX53_28020, partial [Actinomadura sp. BRA 177]|nr:hypothetical protein [Actinomadura sp. BRA 177]
MSPLEIPASRQLIDGAWIPAAEPAGLPVLDPATGRPIQDAPRGGAAGRHAPSMSCREAGASSWLLYNSDTADQHDRER